MPGQAPEVRGEAQAKGCTTKQKEFLACGVSSIRGFWHTRFLAYEVSSYQNEVLYIVETFAQTDIVCLRISRPPALLYDVGKRRMCCFCFCLLYFVLLGGCLFQGSVTVS